MSGSVFHVRLAGGLIGCIVAVVAQLTVVAGLPLWAAVLGGIGFGSTILSIAAARVDGVRGRGAATA